MNNNYINKLTERRDQQLPLNDNQKQILEEYEKYKHIQITPGIYRHKIEQHIQYEIIWVKEERALLKTIKSGAERERTLHWCRKNLETFT